MDLAIDQTSLGARWSIAHGPAGWGMTPVTHIARQAKTVARRKCGRIVVNRGTLEAVYGRWWAYQGNHLQVLWDKRTRRFPRDRCELYYHAPWASPGCLTLSYVRSGPGTSLGTFYAATLVLDEIARLRDAAVIVCHVTNDRISNRLMKRWGWQQHCLEWSGRHFIKRLYGEHPEIASVWRQRLTLDGSMEGSGPICHRQLDSILKKRGNRAG